MLDIKETERLRRIDKARNLRYKKAIAVGMKLLTTPANNFHFASKLLP